MHDKKAPIRNVRTLLINKWIFPSTKNTRKLIILYSGIEIIVIIIINLNFSNKFFWSKPSLIPSIQSIGDTALTIDWTTLIDVKVSKKSLVCSSEFKSVNDLGIRKFIVEKNEISKYLYERVSSNSFNVESFWIYSLISDFFLNINLI